MTDGAYRVLARKWRPQTFDQVVGQAAIVRTLGNALEQGRVAHAYCFSGIRGVGKTTIARLLAKGLNCRRAEGPTPEPCGECEACVEIEESRSLDVIELDAASQTGVDSIRQLNEVARYTPSRDRYRVFIIDEAHMLSTSAFNALLKTLEEPPPHVVFMLATTEPHKILQTVLSRCQHYPLGRIALAELAARLREIADAEGVDISDDGISMVAMAADGSLRDGQSLLDKLIAFGGEHIDDATVAELLGTVDRELLFAATDLIAGRDLAGILELVDRMVEQGTDLHQFGLDLLGHLRALLVVATVDQASEILHLPEADLDRLRVQAGAFAVEDLDRAFALVAASEFRIKQSEVPRYHLEMMLSRLARMPALEPIESLIREMRSGTTGGGSAGGSTGSGRESSRSAGGSARRRGARGGGSVGSTPDGEASGGGGEIGEPRRTAEPTRTTPPRPPTPASEASAPTTAAARRPVSGPPTAPITTAPAASIPETGRPAASAPPAKPVAAGNGSGASEDRRPASSFAAEVRLIFERLRSDKPMVAQVADRAELAELRGDTLFLTFAESNGIFGARLKDRSVLGAIEEAGSAALGRAIRVVAGFEEGGAEPVSELDEPAPETTPPGIDDVPPLAAAGRGEADRRRQELWERAEEEPLVRQFVDELRGNLTDVEEI